MLAMCHFVTHHTKLFVYGGFVRDFIIRGDAHAEMDLDIGFDPEHGKSAGGDKGITQQMANQDLEKLLGMIKQAGAQATMTDDRVGVKVYSVTTSGGEKCSLELVDIAHMRFAAFFFFFFVVKNLGLQLLSDFLISLRPC